MDARQRLDDLIGGFRASQVVRAAAVWRIADQLAAEPLDAAAVASRIGADVGLVYRLLRCLAALGIVTETDDGRFVDTELGQLLRSDLDGGLHSAAVGRTQDSWWAAWGRLPAALEHGQVPYELAWGRPFWDDLRDDPTAQARFNRFMADKTTQFAGELLRCYDFSTARRVVDVGGGSGALLGAVLRASPRVHGVLLDQPGGLAGAPRLLADLGVDHRCDVVAGDFLTTVPSGGDVYLLRQILHDWPDPQARTILDACRRAMRPGSELLVIDHLLPDRVTPDAASRVATEFDLHMFVLFGARERTRLDVTQLLVGAGYTVERVLPTTPEPTIVATAT